MYELDPNDVSTIRKYPAPHLPEWFCEQLSQIGGRDISGKPNLRAIWGQDAKKFAYGQMRPKYPSGLTIEREEILIGLKDLETGIITVATMEEIIANNDPGKIGIKRVISRFVEYVGTPRWMIEEFKPPYRIKDTPSGWEMNRFAYWWNPENRRTEYSDCIGPFPHEGRYDHFMTIQTPDKKYRPIGEDVLDEIRKALSARQRANLTPYTFGVEVQKMWDADDEKYQRNELEMREAMESELMPHFHRLYEDMPRMAMREGVPELMNKQTRFGRAK